MRVRLSHVDAFADAPFTGNPAAVCLLPAPRDEAWMQHVAAEMNLSETAFLTARPGDGFDLRWFTPQVEVDLCGHATLASAHVLWELDHVSDPTILFHTRSGPLSAARTERGIELDFPAQAAVAAPPPAGLLDALGVDARWTGQNASDILVEVGCADAVRRLRPHHDHMVDLLTRGVIVTASADASDHDFVSRFFAPTVGIDEDPVTGSAHCCLGPYWRERLGRDTMVGYQASARGGYVGVRVTGDRVALSGRAVTIFHTVLEP